MKRAIILAPALVVAAVIAAVIAPGTYVAHAAPNGLVSTKNVTSTQRDVMVHSAAMGRDIPLTVFVPKNSSRPAPVLYLLNGAGGGEDKATWQAKTDVARFFADKNVYVVIPMQGKFSYYTDWIKPDPVLGVNKWATFLAKELPPVINATYNTTGANAIAGISSSATSVLNLAIQNKGLYRAVGSYSGCASMSETHGQIFTQLVVEGRGRGDVANMWGPLRGPLWKANDPVRRAAELRGLSLYLSSATGLPGEYDTLAYQPDPETLADQIVVGGVIEAATRYCTDELAASLKRNRIPFTVDRPAAGTHAWPYWQDQLHKSWPQIARALYR